jgi:hypothetical protein
MNDIQPDAWGERYANALEATSAGVNMTDARQFVAYRLGRLHGLRFGVLTSADVVRERLGVMPRLAVLAFAAGMVAGLLVAVVVEVLG